MKEYYTISYPNKRFDKIEVLREHEEEADSFCKNLNDLPCYNFFVQKVILLTVEEYEEMITRIKELEEECDNLVN